MTRYYILDSTDTPVAVPYETWAHWQAAHPPIQRTHINGGIVVTGFLGIRSGLLWLWPQRLLWATAVFIDGRSRHARVYATLHHALAAHQRLVARYQRAA